ncbi:hypothetical protein Bca52824_096626 [Brassica carinata]|uniref:Uncharacterized protein n=1 Tax=Brassica carinata TaxID=52824 RepID=A0A8X7NYX0_BRACI|nr:hypothetical protein Bca52824_096626 [Brassica carinata]
MTTIALRQQNKRLPPEVNRFLYVRNLPLQHNERGDVRHLRQVRRDPPDSRRLRQGHERNGVRRLRGYLRREEGRGPSLRVQRCEPVPDRALLPAREDEQEV